MSKSVTGSSDIKVHCAILYSNLCSNVRVTSLLRILYMERKADSCRMWLRKLAEYSLIPGASQLHLITISIMTLRKKITKGNRCFADWKPRIPPNFGKKLIASVMVQYSSELWHSLEQCVLTDQFWNNMVPPNDFLFEVNFSYWVSLRCIYVIPILLLICDINLLIQVHGSPALGSSWCGALQSYAWFVF